MKLVFTMTAGRTGTGYLAELFRRNLPDALVVHEHLDWRAFGTRSPEVSQLVRFNHVGFDDYVRSFWKRKLDEILESGASCYIETSHVLMKAGLVEALMALPDEHEIHLLSQRRNHVSTVLSYQQRADFINLGNRYLWYLDPGYPRNLLQSKPFLGWGVQGIRLWYVMEIEARAAYYAAKVADRPNFHVHRTELSHVTTAAGAQGLLDQVAPGSGEVKVPPKVNAGPAGLATHPRLRNEIEQMVARVGTFDAEGLVGPLVSSGRDPFAASIPQPSSNRARVTPDTV